MKKLSRIPTMNFPKESGTYNIIQFYIENKPYLRFGKNLDKTKFSYQGCHEDIISLFCEEIDANSTALKNIGNGHGSAAPVSVLPSKPDDSIDCVLVGAGTCKLDLRPEFLRHFTDFPVKFYGKSIKYNRMICSYHLFEMKDEFKKNKVEFNMDDIKYD